MAESNIIWRPTPRQAEFLSAPEEEVLYGGAAGGGKTDALIIDALGAPYRAAEQPEYRALILRKTYPELKEIVDRTATIYPFMYQGAQFHTQDKEWRFPSGARIEFSYLENDADVMRYQSRQFQYIGWEELAQWGTPYPYEYMLSRLRGPERLKLPCFVRGTCNPDGPGAKWLAKRFGISPAGESCSTEVTVNGQRWRRRFIASRLDDNPHLANTGYREKLMMLPDDVRRALLEGRWDEPRVQGAIYGQEIAQAADQGRIRPIPYDPRFPVHTVWDLGWNDAMTIIMVQKPVPSVVNVINYREDNFRRYDEFVQELNSLGYRWGQHFLPHDGGNENPQTGMSTKRLLTNLTRWDVKVLPKDNPEDGIRRARMMFPRVYIDNTARNASTGHLGAARLIDCLRRYRRSVPKTTNEPATPMHDEYSHGADAFRYLSLCADQMTNESDAAAIEWQPQYEPLDAGMGAL